MTKKNEYDDSLVRKRLRILEERMEDVENKLEKMQTRKDVETRWSKK